MAMVIDFHTHVFPPQVKKNRDKYVDADPCFAVLYSQKMARIATAEELIDCMDRDGVDISVIQNIGWTKHELCVETNDYIMESVARYPRRLVGFCSVQPRYGDAALREVERCVKGGIKGVGELRPDIQQLDAEDTELLGPFMDLLVNKGLVLSVHASEPVGHDYQGKGAVTPDILYRLIKQYPDVRIVCAHWGGGLPFYALMPEVKKAMENVYFDSAASPFLYRTEIYRQVAALVGRDKVLFGSDFPLLAQSRLLKEIVSIKLPEETRNMVLADNARTLLNIKEDTVRSTVKI